jgi:hypothetical protein
MDVNLPQAAQQDKCVEGPMAHDIAAPCVENGTIVALPWHIVELE